MLRAILFPSGGLASASPAENLPDLQRTTPCCPKSASDSNKLILRSLIAQAFISLLKGVSRRPFTLEESRRLLCTQWKSRPCHKHTLSSIHVARIRLAPFQNTNLPFISIRQCLVDADIQTTPHPLIMFLPF